MNPVRSLMGEGARLQSQQIDSDEPALIGSSFCGATLRGFCQVIAKPLGGAL